MRIAQVVSLWASVPPVGYGGTELVVANLCRELAKKGHQVTLYAAGDSSLLVEKRSVVEKALGSLVEAGNMDPSEVIKYELLNSLKAFKESDDFDIIHCHSHFLGAALANLSKVPVIHTLHSYPKGPELEIFKLNKLNLCSISQRFRQVVSDLDFCAVVYNGIDIANFQFNPSGASHYITIGRLSPKKGIGDAVKVALAAGVSLKIASPLPKEGAKSWLADNNYYSDFVKPYVDGKQIIHVGEVLQDEKSQFFNAKALILPIAWEEPFGLVVAEALACGTPVIAFGLGAIPEIVEDGKQGYVIPSGNFNQMVAAVKRIDQMPEAEYLQMRQSCRERVEKNFTSSIMTDRYLKLYQELTK